MFSECLYGTISTLIKDQSGNDWEGNPTSMKERERDQFSLDLQSCGKYFETLRAPTLLWNQLSNWLPYVDFLLFLHLDRNIPTWAPFLSLPNWCFLFLLGWVTIRVVSLMPVHSHIHLVPLILDCTNCHFFGITYKLDLVTVNEDVIKKYWCKISHLWSGNWIRRRLKHFRCIWP